MRGIHISDGDCFCSGCNSKDNNKEITVNYKVWTLCFSCRSKLKKELTKVDCRTLRTATCRKPKLKENTCVHCGCKYEAWDHVHMRRSCPNCVNYDVS